MRFLLKGAAYLILFACIAVLTGYITYYFLTTTKSYEVPYLAGKSLLDANKLLIDKKLYLRIEGEAHDADIPSNYILKQNIPAGNLVKAGRTIGVIISKGPKMLYVPMLSGLVLDDAEELARQNNIKIDRIITVHSHTVERNRVIAQDPNPEEYGSGGITLIVSMGPYDDIFVCPSFKDLPIAEAKQLAQSLGLYISISGSGNKVSAQDPKASSLIKRGVTMHLELTEERDRKWWL